MTHPARVGAVEIKRWTRFGKDRLYVSQRGEPIGWWDLNANEPHPARIEQLDTLRIAVAGWAGMPVEVAPPPTQAQQQTSWTDLALTQPGQSVLSQVAHIEGQRRAIPWVPRPPRRSFIGWLTANREERHQFRHALNNWRQVHEQQLQFDRHLQSQAKPWSVGAEGELLVAREIDALIRMDPRWRVLHAVPVGSAGSDIDHVLIGPGGVFTLNAKHHARKHIWVAHQTFLVNGTRQPYIRNSRREAARASRLLTAACGFPVSVTAIIVPVNARSLTIREAPAGVDVINRQRLVSWMRRYVEQIPAPVVGTIYATARRSTTWR